MSCCSETDVNYEKSDKGFSLRDKHHGRKVFRNMRDVSELPHVKTRMETPLTQKHKEGEQDESDFVESGQISASNKSTVIKPFPLFYVEV